jgi:hypothetical protein
MRHGGQTKIPILLLVILLLLSVEFGQPADVTAQPKLGYDPSGGLAVVFLLVWLLLRRI